MKIFEPLNGIYTNYWPDGKIKSESQFKDGNRHGLYFEYWPTGKIKREEQFENGESLGGKSFDETGQEIVDEFFVFELHPEFPGGQESMIAYINDTIQYPTNFWGRKDVGTVIVRFVVTETGKIEKVSMAQSISRLLDKEAMRVVRSMPNWVPGYQNGKRVRVAYNLPILFKLE